MYSTLARIEEQLAIREEMAHEQHDRDADPVDPQLAIIRACDHPDQSMTSAGPCCLECWNRSVAARRTARKAQLAAMPRCEISGCKARHTWTLADVRLCGRHKGRVEAKVSGMGVWGMTMRWDRQTVLSLAGSK